MRQALILMCFCSMLAVQAKGEEEVLDRIVAVVGRDAILASEVDELVQMQALQTGRRLNSMSPSEIQTMRCTLLGGMVDDRLLVIKARTDSVEVLPQEVEQGLRDQMAQLKARFPTEDAYREQLRIEGVTERELRNRFRMQQERYLLRQRLMAQMAQEIAITFRELEQFYDLYSDSLSLVPASVTISHITRFTRPGDSALVAARELIGGARLRLDAGEDFGDVARDVSQDQGTAGQGGDLGYFGRGEMVPEFEAAAFNLDSGQTSGVIMTDYGLHLIQNLGYRGDRVRARHILALARPGSGDFRATKDTILAVYGRIQEQGGRFADHAREHSMDPNVRETGGRLGPLSPQELPPLFGQAMSTLEVGDVSYPFETEPGVYHIVKLEARTREHRMNMGDDRRQLEEMLRQQRLVKRLQEIIAKERGRVYVDVRMQECSSVGATN